MKIYKKTKQILFINNTFYNIKQKRLTKINHIWIFHLFIIKKHKFNLYFNKYKINNLFNNNLNKFLIKMNYQNYGI